MTDETNDRGDALEGLLKDADKVLETKTDDTAKPSETKAEGEVKADDKDKEKDKEKEKEPSIPKSRFDEAVQKERADKEALAARVKEYEERDAQAQVADDFAGAQKMVKDMIKQHTAYLADGELDKASDLMERILNLNSAIQDRRTDHKTLATKYAAKEEVQYDALVAKLEIDHPAINPDSDEYDKGLVENVQAMMSGFIQTQRMTAPMALAKAIKTLLPDKAKAQGGDAGLKRKEEAVKKALDAKEKQPASTGGVGIDHDKEGGPLDAAAVMKMNWEEFVKLPDSELSKMRGDYL